MTLAQCLKQHGLVWLVASIWFVESFLCEAPRVTFFLVLSLESILLAFMEVFDPRPNDVKIFVSMAWFQVTLASALGYFSYYNRELEVFALGLFLLVGGVVAVRYGSKAESGMKGILASGLNILLTLGLCGILFPGRAFGYCGVWTFVLAGTVFWLSFGITSWNPRWRYPNRSAGHPAWPE